MERFAILVAGGQGLRMGGDVPKQFLPLGGRPVLMHTIDRFREAFPDMHIIVVLPQGQHDYWHDLCRRHHLEGGFLTAPGGDTRFHSVLNGLNAIPADVSEGLVGVHDGVRPFVSRDTLRRCYEEAARSGTAVPVVPVVETLRHVSPDGESMTVPRSDYRLVQTPQVFSLALLRRAYRQPYAPQFTDDASVVEALGERITLVEGNRENIKLTTPADLLLAKGIMEAR